jgi:hypothetical protein
MLWIDEQGPDVPSIRVADCEANDLVLALDNPASARLFDRVYDFFIGDDARSEPVLLDRMAYAHDFADIRSEGSA